MSSPAFDPRSGWPQRNLGENPIANHEIADVTRKRPRSTAGMQVFGTETAAGHSGNRNPSVASAPRNGVGSRWTTWFSAARWLQRAPGTRNVLVVGAGGLGRRVVTHLENHPEAARKVCGFLDDRRPLRDGVIGRISSLAFLARRKFVEEVILAEPHNREINLRVLGEARRLGLAVRLVPDLFGCEPSQEVGERIGGVPMICLHEGRWPAANSTLKRWLDGAGAALALVAIAPPAHDDRGTHQAGLNRPGVLCG